MKIIKINIQTPSPVGIIEAVRVLKKGGVIVYPTETCYGLGAVIDQPTAIKKIFLIKGRSKKPLPLVAGNLAQIKKIAKLDSFELRLVKKYWPGPLTILLKTKRKLSKGLQRNGRVAVRIPGLALARNLCLKLGSPLTATSANLAGQPASYKVKDAIKQFKNRNFKPDLFLDAGRLPKIKPSTIVVIEADKMKPYSSRARVVISGILRPMSAAADFGRRRPKPPTPSFAKATEGSPRLHFHKAGWRGIRRRRIKILRKGPIKINV